MKRREFIATLGGMAIAAPLASAQDAGRMRRIGILRPGASSDPSLDAFRRGLRDLGYFEDRNIAIEYRAPDGRIDFDALARELVSLRVDVIVAEHSSAIQ